MADNSNEDSFTSKLGIQLVSPRVYRSLIDLHADTPRAVLTAVGMPGIGKTAIPKQAARDRNAPYAALHLPTMSIEDFHIPTTASDSKMYYDRRIPRKFQALLEYVERLKKENKGVFPEGRNPILAFEELNRATDKAVTRAAFTTLEDRMIGDVCIPDEVQFVVTMNPTGGAMAVNEFERDPAHRRRLMMVGIAPSHADFIKYARSMGEGFHGKVFEHLEAQPMWFYDDKPMHQGKKFPCPSSWETVSQVCLVFERKGISLSSQEARAAFSGIVGDVAAEAFGEFVKDATIVITPEEVMSGFRKDSGVQKRFRKLLNENKLDKVSTLTQGVALRMFADAKRKPETYAEQIGLFMEEMPEEVMLAFFKDLTSQSKLADRGNEQLSAFNALVNSMGCFKTAVQRLQNARIRAKQEAEASGFSAN